MADVQFSDESGNGSGKSDRKDKIKLVLAVLFVILSFVIFGLALNNYLQNRQKYVDFQQQQALLSLKRDLTDNRY